MSTKSTIRHQHPDGSGVSFHLYSDWIDECSGHDVVHLALDGIPFNVSAGGNSLFVELTLPRRLAVILGLLPGPLGESVPVVDSESVPVVDSGRRSGGFRGAMSDAQQIELLRSALKDARSDLFLQIESKHGAQKAGEHPSVAKADLALKSTISA